MKKSYWQSMFVGDERSKDACRSWFDPLSEGMTPYKAEVLCDIQTDREKKARAFMTDETGRHWKFVRTLGGREFSISRVAISTLVDLSEVGSAVDGMENGA